MSDVSSSNIEASSIEGSALPNPIPKEYRQNNESLGDSILSSSPGDQNNNQLGVSQSAAELRRVVEKKPFKFCDNLTNLDKSTTFFEPINAHKKDSVIKEENPEDEQKETEGSTQQSKIAKSSIIERINQEIDEKLECLLGNLERYLKKKENCEEIANKMKDLREKSLQNQTKDLIFLKEIFEKSVGEPRKVDTSKIAQTMENLQKNKEVIELFENIEKDEGIKNTMMEKGVMEAEWQLNQKIEEKISPILQKTLDKFLKDLKLKFEDFEKKIDVKAFFEVKRFEFKHLMPKNKDFMPQNWALGLGVLSGVIGIVQLLRKMKKSGGIAIGLGVALSLLSMRKKDKNKEFQPFFEELKGKNKEISLKLMADVEEYLRKMSEEAEKLDLSENEKEIRNSFSQLEDLLKN